MTMYDDENASFDDENPPEESNNRTFLLIAGILGGLVLLGICAVVGYLVFSNVTGQQQEAVAFQQATDQAATIQVGLTQTAAVQALTETAAPTSTPDPTDTPVIAQASATITPTQNPATATVGAAFTQIAVSTQTIIATSTALPNTGFVDEFGAPGLMMMAIALVVVIFLVRRLRTTPAK
jgi:cytoskeletal protein RodZ